MDWHFLYASQKEPMLTQILWIIRQGLIQIVPRVVHSKMMTLDFQMIVIAMMISVPIQVAVNNQKRFALNSRAKRCCHYQMNMLLR